MTSRFIVTLGIIMTLASPSGLSATGSVDHAPEANGEDHVALFHLGRIALAEKDLDGAIERLQGAVRLNGDDSAYRLWLGRAYIAKLQTVSYFEQGVLAGRALDNLRKAVDLDPTNIEARISLGEYYLNAPSIAGGSQKKAVEQAEEVLKHNPLKGNSMMAQVHMHNKEYDLAIARLNACIEAAPEEPEYHYRLGMVYQTIESYEDAFATFEYLLSKDPNDRGALYQIGRTAAHSGTNLDRGIECLRSYLAMEAAPGMPGHDGAHWRLGMLYEHRRDRESARREYEAAIRINESEERYRESLRKLDAAPATTVTQ